MMQHLVPAAPSQQVGRATPRQLDRKKIMKKNQRVAFSSIDQFKKTLGEAKLVFFHVFDSESNPNLLSLFATSTDDEILLLMDTREDQGFLASTPIVVQVTAPPRQFISKALLGMRGIGAWAKGTFFGFEESEENFAAFLDNARSFAFAGNASSS